MPSSVMIALVAGGTLNSSAANFNTAVNGVFSGTDKLQRDLDKKYILKLLSVNLHFVRQFRV